MESIRTGVTPLSDGYQGLAVVAVLEAANESLMNGGLRVPVRIPTMVEIASRQPLQPAEGHPVAPNGSGHAVGSNGNGNGVASNGNGHPVVRANSHDAPVHPVSSVTAPDDPAVAFPEL